MDIFSGSNDPNSGGLLIFVRKDILELASEARGPQCNISKNIFSPGRIMSLDLTFALGNLSIWNAHDFGILDDDRIFARQFFAQKLQVSKLNPLADIVLFVGDLNRSGPSDLRFYLDPTEQMQYSANPSVHRLNVTAQQSAWDHLLGQCVELDTQKHSHFCKAGNFESRIDRAFWTVPTWASRSLNLHMPVFLPAHSMHSQGLSDHSPIGVVCSVKSSLPPSARPIPSFITRHPFFRQSLAMYEAEHDISYGTLLKHANNNPFDALSKYTDIIRRVAASTRNHLLEIGDTGQSKDCLLAALSRCVFFFNKLSLAKFLIHKYRMASEHIYIRDGIVRMHNASILGDTISMHRRHAINSAINDAQGIIGSSRAGSAKAKRAAAAITRNSSLMRQWIPIHKFVQLGAVLDEDGQVVEDSIPGVITSLANYWRPFFDGSMHAAPLPLIQNFLDEMSFSQWDWSSFRMPNRKNLCQSIKEAADSAPGKDGVPYSGLMRSDLESSPLPLLLEDAMTTMKHASDASPLPPLWF